MNNKAAFVKSKVGADVHWKSSTVVLHPVVPRAGAGLEGDEFREVAVAAAQAWNNALQGCGAPVIQIAPLELKSRGHGQDRASILEIMSSEWCPPNARDDEACYPAHQLATTHLYSSDGDPRQSDPIVIEADVVVNAFHFKWNGEKGRDELAGVLVHEFGHVLGLDHSCLIFAECDEAARASVMYLDPLEPGRQLMLLPDSASTQLLCQFYQGTNDEGNAAAQTGVVAVAIPILVLIVGACIYTLGARLRRGAS